MSTLDPTRRPLSGTLLLVGILSLILTGAASAQAPAKPTIDEILAGDEALTVRWSAPTGEAVTQYNLQYRIGGGNWAELSQVWTLSSGRLVYVLGGLTNGVEYDVQMQTVDSNRPGATVSVWSDIVKGTPAEFGDDQASATILALNTRLGGTIGSADDLDFFQVSISERTALQFYTTGNELDAVVEFFAPDVGGGVESVATNDSSYPDGWRLNPALFLELTENASSGDPETYFFKLSAKDGQTGPYTLNIRTFVDDARELGNADSVELNEPLLVHLQGEEDTRHHRLVVTEAADVIIHGWSFEEFSVSLLDDSGNWITESDLGLLPSGVEQFLAREKLEPGVYYLKLNLKLNFGLGAESGEFRSGVAVVHVRTVTEPGDTAGTALPLTLGDTAGYFGIPAGGTFDFFTSVGYFQFQLSEPNHVFVRAFSRDVGVDGTVLDSGGNPVEGSNYQETFWYRGPMGFTFTGRLEAGTYFVKVERVGFVGGARGKYTVLAATDTPQRVYVEECSGPAPAPIADELYGCQWHLTANGRFPAVADINVEDLWAAGHTGEGVTVAIVDDGIDYEHEDLADNVDGRRNFDYTAPEFAPEDAQNPRHPASDHGTAVAGLVAARDNEVGGRGVAPRATVYGFNLLQLPTDGNVLDAMTRELGTAVSVNSWGLIGGARPTAAPFAWRLAVDYSLRRGYDGKGTFFIFAAGNEHRTFGYSTLDGFANYYGVTAVCAVDIDGERADYSEYGANLWVCGPSDGADENGAKQGMFTTVNFGRYTWRYGGTSAAGAVVAGVAALVRQVDESLTWRDVKVILATSAQKNDPTDYLWKAGALKYGSTTESYNYNHKYGFGLVDAAAAVELAKNWEHLRPLIKTEPIEANPNLGIPGPFSLFDPADEIVATTIEVDSEVEFIEYVDVNIILDNPADFRDLAIELVSPSGARSVLSPATPLKVCGDLAPCLDGPFRFGTARHLGEDPSGTWTLVLQDRLRFAEMVLESWSLAFYGHGAPVPPPPAPTVYPPTVTSVLGGSGSLTVSWTAGYVQGGRVAGYDLRYIESAAIDKSDENWTVLRSRSRKLSYRLTGLKGRTQYHVQVRIVGGTGTSAWSGTRSGTTRAEPPPPEPPPPEPPPPEPPPPEPPRPSGPPEASFKFGADCEGDLCRARTSVPIVFEDTSTGLVESRTWDFGDGRTTGEEAVEHSWSGPGFYTVTLTVRGGAALSTTSRVFLVEASDPAGSCMASAETLCLRDSRFEVSVAWLSEGGGSGAGTVVHAGTNDSGLFWFFGRDHWEVLIKVLNGCALNDHVWVYGAATTNQGYRITVKDTVTGDLRQYENAAGERASAITDDRAFAGACDDALPAAASGRVARTTSADGVDAAAGGWLAAGSPRPSGASWDALGIPQAIASASEESGCAANSTSLCLLDGRYEVTVVWSTAEGRDGPGRPVRARTADSGVFYFFGPGNWEMLVSVLDGCAFNGHHWVLAGSATDLGLDLTVRDTTTGAVRAYTKKPGRPAPAVVDVGAFPNACTAAGDQ